MESSDIYIGIAIFVGILLVLGFYFYKNPKKKVIATPHAVPSAGNNTLILQAYERLITLSERIGFQSLSQRLHSDLLNASELANVYAEAIRSEYDYNISQQLYVNEGIWQAITDFKDQQLFILNQVVKTLPAQANGHTLNEALALFLKMDENATLQHTVLQLIRFEAKKQIHTR